MSQLRSHQLWLDTDGVEGKRLVLKNTKVVGRFGKYRNFDKAKLENVVFANRDIAKCSFHDDSGHKNVEFVHLLSSFFSVPKTS